MEGKFTGERELIVVRNVDAAPTLTSGVDEISELLQRTGATIRPLFGHSEERLDLEAAAAALDMPPAPRLSTYYRVFAPDESLDALAQALRAISVVQAAYVKPAAQPAYINAGLVPLASQPAAVTPDFSGRQIYLNAAPTGIDARFAWTVPGGHGAGVKIIDVEGAWNYAHEDLRLNKGGVVDGTPTTDPGWVNHGTAVLGEIGGDLNNFGITGICSDALISSVSIFGLGSAAAIHSAASRLSQGDIILIELHRPGPRFNFESRPDQSGFIAVEWWPDDCDAIRYAIARGVIVVEAAGNGAENLDDQIYSVPAAGFPTNWGNPFWRGAHDSGAILVGAGAPPPGTHGQTYGPDRSRLDFSNYGSSLDVQGWGRCVTTTGYGDLQGGSSPNVWYTDSFAGTSSASPIIVGTLGSLQGIMRARGASLTPARARALLRETGSPQQDGPHGAAATQRIGSRPDLRQLIARVPAHSPDAPIFHSAGFAAPEPDLPAPGAPSHSLLDLDPLAAPDVSGAIHGLATPIFAIITPEPRLAPITVQWYWQSPGFSIVSASHTAVIVYTDHGRNDSSQTLQYNNVGLNVPYDFGGRIQGGTLIARCMVHWRRNSDGATGSTGWGEQRGEVRGSNPAKSTVRNALPDVSVQVLAYLESRFRQFDNANLPMFGPPRGFGTMQLDTPPPSPQEIWDWKQNVAGGVGLYNQKRGEVARHFNNIYASNPQAPHLTTDQLNLALYQYYNGGFYWDWDQAAKVWKKVGTTSYGDAAMHVEQLVRAATPPADWN